MEEDLAEIDGRRDSRAQSEGLAARGPFPK